MKRALAILTTTALIVACAHRSPLDPPWHSAPKGVTLQVLGHRVQMGVPYVTARLRNASGKPITLALGTPPTPAYFSEKREGTGWFGPLDFFAGGCGVGRGGSQTLAPGGQITFDAMVPYTAKGEFRLGLYSVDGVALRSSTFRLPGVIPSVAPN